MPKYKNITQFVRPVVINGKRVAVKPNDVVFSDRELDVAIYTFLEKTDDKTPTSQVKELGPQKISVAKPEDVKLVKQQITDVSAKIDAIKDSPEQIASVKKELESFKTDILRKLEIMKSAVQSVSDNHEELTNVVHELEKEIYENGAVVIEGLDDEKQG